MKRTFLNFLDGLALKPGERWRGDCYECGGNNTLSVHNEYGTILYHCFRASCSLSGKTSGPVSAKDLEHLLQPREEELNEVFSIPDHFVPVYGRSDVTSYLVNNHCWEAFTDKRVDVLYDVKDSRVVFLIKHNGDYYGAVGRSLVRTKSPKWFIYSVGSYPFVVGARTSYDGPVGGYGLAQRAICIVEDCASACAVTCCMDGLSLLGTNLGTKHINHLLDYDIAYVALDKDASKKALEMQLDLSPFIETEVVLLEKDLKYCDEEEIKKVLGYGENKKKALFSKAN